MKKYLRAGYNSFDPRAEETDDPVYRIYFNDSNQKLIQGRNMAAVLDYIDISTQYSIEDVVKIEDVDWFK